ncbi:MAG TPA: hypothetical protein IAC62_14130 [Candidatus Pelethocola excrementipullorum]|nr:hypothetical protein [Candidatus Pelethocola excrementipullorum]
MNKVIVQAIKMAIGGCLSIYIALLLNLEFAMSAGIITMLTIATTKWETLKLSLSRILTFLMSVFILWVIFRYIKSDWIAYGIFILLLVVISEYLGWRSTISINAVIGTHFLTTHDFSFAFIINEGLLVLIGLSFAILLNLFQGTGNQKNRIIDDIRDTETKLQEILEALANYLNSNPMGDDVWTDIIVLENKLETYIERAYEYRNNIFQSHPSYYIHYFEMRMKQCTVLFNLHQEMKKIRNLPSQAAIIAEYVSYLKEHVVEMNDPKEQMERLKQLSEDMKKQELPVTREEFESRAQLYHILMDLEDFLVFKKRFVDSIDKKQLEIYWK